MTFHKGSIICSQLRQQRSSGGPSLSTVRPILLERSRVRRAQFRTARAFARR